MMSEGSNPQNIASFDASFSSFTNYDGVGMSQTQNSQAGKSSNMHSNRAFNGPSMKGPPPGQYPGQQTPPYPGKSPSPHMSGPPVFTQNAATNSMPPLGQPGPPRQPGSYGPPPAQTFTNGPLTGVHTPPKSVSPRPLLSQDRPGSAPGFNQSHHAPPVSSTPPPRGHSLVPPDDSSPHRSSSQPSLSSSGSQLPNQTQPLFTQLQTPTQFNSLSQPMVNPEHLRASPRPFTPPSQPSTPVATPVSSTPSPLPSSQALYNQPPMLKYTAQNTGTGMGPTQQHQPSMGPPLSGMTPTHPVITPPLSGIGMPQQPGLGPPLPRIGPPQQPGVGPPPPGTSQYMPPSQVGPPPVSSQPPQSIATPSGHTGSLSALSSGKPKRPVMPSQPSGYMLNAGMTPAMSQASPGQQATQVSPPSSISNQPNIQAPPTMGGSYQGQSQEAGGRLGGRRQYPQGQYPQTGQTNLPGGNTMSQTIPNSMSGSTMSNNMAGPTSFSSGPGNVQAPSYGSTKLDGPISRMSVQSGSQPINLLEHRSILPTTPMELPYPPLTSLELQKRNVDPNLICSTLNAIPETQSLLNKCKLPFGINLHPFKDLPNLSVIHSTVITRCRACRTYINPFVSFTDSRRWKCNMCFRTNDLPEEFSYDPTSRTYGDPTKRPEIKNATVEFIAPSEYMLRPPQPAVFVFAFDVSFNAIETGYLHIACNILKDNLDRLPGDARTMIGFITYNSTIQFYSLKSKLSQPQMFIVSDLDDVFLPAPDDLLVNLKENKEMIAQLLESLPEMFNGTTDTHSATGAAMRAALKLTGATGGRVSVFQTCLPSLGPGQLKKREEGGQKENSKDVANLNPATDYYKKFALDCAAEQVAVDLFLLAGQYADIATLMCASRYSGGCVSYYPDFHAVRNPTLTEKFENELERYLTRKIGFEAVMRVRCTKGLGIHTFHGNFFVRSTDLLSLPNINPDAGYSMQISIEDSLVDINAACFQSALLYTSSKGERRIRVHTLALPITNKISEVFSFANTQAIAVLLSKMAADRTLMSSIGDAREALMNCLVDSLTAYRSTVSSVQPLPGQLIVPYSLRLLPLYILALLKHTSCSLDGSIRTDERCYAMQQLKVQPMFLAMLNIYPSLYSIHDLTDEGGKTTKMFGLVPQPPILQLSGEKLSRRGVFLMDCGQYIYIWVGKDVSEESCLSLFNVPSFHSIPENMLALPELENPLSERVHRFLSYLQSLRQCHAALYIIREDSRLRTKFLNYLIDDRSQSVMSYYEFMVHVQKQISK